MRRALRLLAVSVWLPVAAHPAAAQVAATTDLDLRQHVTTLASDEFEGRLTGSTGEAQAANYIVERLQEIGARPLPGQTGFRLPFEFTAGTRDGGSSVTVRGRTFEGTEIVQALSFSDNAEVSGDVVFAGYGIVVPESQGFGYDSYQGLDVADKVVVVLRYFPEDTDPQTRGILSRYAGLRYKAMAARQRGAKALLVVTGPRSPNAGLTVAMTFDTALAGSGIVAASVNGQVAEALWQGRDQSLADAQRALDSGNPHVMGFALEGVSATVTAAVERERRRGYNVAGYLPATTEPLPKPWLVVGAHYDHLGRGDHGNSLATSAEAGNVHAGADDNASGTAAVLGLGTLLSSQPRQRHVLLIFWSGEEIGLVGSNSFAGAPPVPVNGMAAYVNFDMVGRMVDNKLTVQATGTSPVWTRFIEQANVSAGFDLFVQPDPYVPTDSASFNQVGVPTLNFFTGAHADYHKPSDTAEKINYDDLERIVRFAAAIVRRTAALETPPEFVKVEQQTTGGGSREGIRIFTGTIPDYATDVKGLLLSGVIGGGPAEQAGLQKGDVIIEIAGQTIANVYDYTYALEVLKVGEAAKVIYLRDGEKRETTLTPAARR
jgi:hypothetical protein